MMKSVKIAPDNKFSSERKEFGFSLVREFLVSHLSLKLD